MGCSTDTTELDHHRSVSSYHGTNAQEQRPGTTAKTVAGGRVNEGEKAIRLTDEQRLDWLRLIRSQNVGPRGIMAQTPQARGHDPRPVVPACT